MKKNAMKLVSLVLVMTLVLLLGGCSSGDKEALLGTWVAEMDMTDLFNDSIKMGAGEEIGAYLNVNDFTLTMLLTFNEDDTYTMVLDESALEDTVAAMRSDLQAGLEQYLIDSVAAQLGIEMSIEEILEASGVTMEELMDEIITQDLIDSMVADIASEGKFLAEEGKLYLSAGFDYEVDKNIYETYTLDGDSLTLLEYISTEEVDEYTKSMYPMAFTKVS